MYLKNVSQFTVALAFLFIGYSTASSAAEPDEVIGKINDKPITKNQLLTYIEFNAPKSNLQDPEIKNRVLQSFIGRELLYQEGLNKKLDQSDMVKQVIKEQRHAVISQALAGEILKASPITEEQLRAIYDKQISEITKNEKTDGKPTQLPAYEQVRGRIGKSLQDKMISEYIGELFKKAKIELK